MDRQIIITICREYGSMGHEIAKQLAERLDVKLYDKELLYGMAEAEGMDPKIIHKYDEKAINPFMSKTIGNHSNSIEKILAEKIFEYQRQIAATGESFVIVGRCSDFVLKDVPNTIRVFITSDYNTKLTRIMDIQNLDVKAAALKIAKEDKIRRSYHNHHCDTKWGDSRAYDITVNASKLGAEGTVEFLYNYVQLYKNKENNK